MAEPEPVDWRNQAMSQVWGLHPVFQMHILLKLFLLGGGGTAMLNEGGTEQEIRKDLETVSAAWERAIVSNDAGAIGQFMTDDWVIVSATGITKKSDFLAVVASGDLTHESFKGNIVSVRGYGDTGVVTGRVSNNGTYRSQPFSADEWTTDVFVKRDGQWRCVHSHITAVKE